MSKHFLDQLQAVLSVQELLSQLQPDGSLTTVLSGVLLLVADALDSADGRIELLDRPPLNGLTATMLNSRVRNLPVAGSQDRTESSHRNVASMLVADSLQRRNLFTNWHTPSATSSWSAVCAPISHQDVNAGTISVLKEGKNRFSQRDLAFLAVCAGQLGAALDHLQLGVRLQAAEERAQTLLADKENLAAILVHDLKGPVGNIVTSLELVEQDRKRHAASGPGALLEIAIRSSQRLRALVDSLLDISRLEAGQTVQDIQTVGVAGLLDYVTELLEADTAERGVRIECNLAPNLPSVLGNADMLQRVLLNLLDNALKVSKRGQTITVEALFQPEQEAVKICVADEGPGIPEEYREMIFDKYQRVEGSSSSKGLGLGLAFCKLAVEAHGGQIWLETKPHRGASFCLTIPADTQGRPISAE